MNECLKPEQYHRRSRWRCWQQRSFLLRFKCHQEPLRKEADRTISPEVVMIVW